MKTNRKAQCPCGSGLKYKECCMEDEEHDRKQRTKRHKGRPEDARNKAEDIESLDAILNE